MSYPYYQNSRGWGSSRFQIGTPPPPSFSAQPNWSGVDFYRAGGVNPNHSLFQSILEGVNRIPPEPAFSSRESRDLHRQVYSGLVGLAEILPSDIGLAAAYEAYRKFKYHPSSLADPLGGTSSTQREAMMGLAVAEASALWQYSGHATDNYGLRDATESAALTASRLWYRKYGASGSMGGTSFPRSQGSMNLTPSPNMPPILPPSMTSRDYGYNNSGIGANQYSRSRRSSVPAVSRLDYSPQFSGGIPTTDPISYARGRSGISGSYTPPMGGPQGAPLPPSPYAGGMAIPPGPAQQYSQTQPYGATGLGATQPSSIYNNPGYASQQAGSAPMPFIIQPQGSSYPYPATSTQSVAGSMPSMSAMSGQAPGAYTMPTGQPGMSMSMPSGNSVMPMQGAAAGLSMQGGMLAGAYQPSAGYPSYGMTGTSVTGAMGAGMGGMQAGGVAGGSYGGTTGGYGMPGAMQPQQQQPQQGPIIIRRGRSRRNSFDGRYHDRRARSSEPRVVTFGGATAIPSGTGMGMGNGMVPAVGRGGYGGGRYL